MAKHKHRQHDEDLGDVLDEDRSFLDIDIHILDEEWMRQPKLFEKYSRELADAEFELDMAKNGLKVTAAEIGRAVRDEPESFGIKKGRATEGAIEEIVLLQSRYQKALAKQNAAKHLVAMLTAAVKALDQRKTALMKLVDLHGQQYFSSPRASGEARDMAERGREKARSRKVNRARRNRLEEDDDDDDGDESF